VLLVNLTTFAESSKESQYKNKLDTVQQREMAAREQIVQEQVKIENLKQDIQSCNQKISEALNKKYSLLGTDENGLLSVSNSLDNVIFQYKTFATTSTSEIVNYQKHVDSLHHFVIQIKNTSKLAHINDIAKKMQIIDELYYKILNSINEYQVQQVALTQAGSSNSSVLQQTTDLQTTGTIDSNNLVNEWIVKFVGNERESLFKIAGYAQVYGDPYQWRKIYNANKDLIDKNYERFQKYQKSDVSVNPQDVLFPGQILKIPR
jgi:nucleoid-associated protein YgaU